MINLQQKNNIITITKKLCQAEILFYPTKKELLDSLTKFLDHRKIESIELKTEENIAREFFDWLYPTPWTEADTAKFSQKTKDDLKNILPNS